MISKERLEELIKQDATIYEVKYGKINPVSLKNKIRFISKKYPVIVFEPRPNEKYKHHKYFDKLFETLEEAEWHKEFGCIERTERLELPTWEEFKKLEFYTKTSRIIFEREIESYPIYPDLDKEQDYEFIQIWELTFDGGSGCVYHEPATKENYTLACRKCKELFLGELDDDT